MAKLSVNINKFATLRNARGHNNPNVLQIAMDVQKFGADGVTVHPRPDERHIRYSDVYAIKEKISIEFNIEGNCREDKFVDLVLQTKPTQVTLVPDAEGHITSNHGWTTITNQEYLKKMVSIFKKADIRTSIFCDANIEMIKAAATTGTDRIELYTESFANAYIANKCKTEDGEKILKQFIDAAKCATSLGLAINAGHDLDLNNLPTLIKAISNISEVSIGHALVCNAIYLGLENTIQLYKRNCNL